MRRLRQAARRDRNPRRRAHGAVAVLACGTALLIAPAAFADLSPPTAPPQLTKRTCAHYGVVTTPAGPVARCLAHTDSTLRAHRTRHSNTTGTPAAARESATTRATVRSRGGGQPGTPSASRPARAAAVIAAAGHRPAHGAGGGGASPALMAALAAGVAVVALALTGVFTRRRRRYMHAAAS